jgi:hypothetical protein
VRDRDVSDEIPVADAIEQNQETAPEPAAVDSPDAPMEANASDWQEQLQEIPEDDDAHRQ